MAEGFRRSIERYIRRKDSILAKTATFICNKTGPEYTNSRFKRNFDLSLALPIWVVSLPIQGLIKMAIKLEDGGSSLYVDQDRFSIGQDSSIKKLPLRKFRTMRPDADSMTGIPENIRGTDKDPRLTRVGKFLRRHNLDELPQLWQVIRGEMSLIGIRAASKRDVFEVGEMVSHPQYSQWVNSYMQGRPAIFHPQAALYGSDRKGGDYGRLRLHSDIHYEQNASLGTDLYLATRYIIGIKKGRRGVLNLA